MLRGRQGAAPAIPVDIGDIAPGATESDQVTLSLEDDRRYDLEGSLLIGP